MPIARAKLLVVAATERELAPAEGWRTLACGVGPVDAAATTASEVARQRPDAILHVGIAGARRGSALRPGQLVIGSRAEYRDAEADGAWVVCHLQASPALLSGARRALPEAAVTAIATSARVGGAEGADVEAMEGFAVLRAAAMAGIPAIELRAVSNFIEEPDRSRWQIDVALAALSAAVPRLVQALADA